MTEEISIWRWAVTDNLDARFAQLAGATDKAFAEISSEMSVEGAEEAPDAAQLARETEAKFRAMDLPDEILQTMLKGLESMMDEARSEEGNAEDTGPDLDGRMGVALASSHMFSDDPFASLEHHEIEAQVAALMEQYRASIAKAIGEEGQKLGAFLGLSDARMNDVDEILVQAGVDSVAWIWIKDKTAFYLSHWHEDNALPIDLEFGRAPVAFFDTLKAQF